MKVCVIGSGYVGLVAGACFADTGNSVTCADIDARKIEGLKKNVLPIYEPGLHEIVERNQHDGRLSFTTDVAAAIRANDVIFIAVGTPPGEDGSADLKHVCAVAKTIGENLVGFKVVVDKSTVPVGTGARVAEIIREHAPDGDFAVVSNPEFLKEGAAVNDFLKPDRIVIGTDDERARRVMAQLYAPYQRTSERIIFMDVPSAEMTKYAANAMLATRISFMNEIARLCEDVGADVSAVRRGIGSDPRIGNKFLFPGVGFGGSCFPKDVRALMDTGRKRGQPMHILQAVFDVNERQKLRLVERVVEHFGEDLSGLTLAVWGLAFKPQTDDMREAPAITIIRALRDRGARIRATDPVALETGREAVGEDVEYVDSEYAAAEGADALLVVTEWSEYRTPDFPRLKSLLRNPVVFDGRNLYDPAYMAELGFVHYSIGRATVGK
ncbi:MAG: UDP-glucose/GDP-mannose dehydrogenase family protein [Myxococcales bacterium]|nr:UDP-glucose/GDP-mannose dehydrogenase family protein [Myxococcales bacterium]